MDALLWDHSINEDAKDFAQGLKPAEEIARFSVDEHLSDIERINLFLSGGQLVQQRKAIEGIPALIKSKGRAGWEAVRDNLFMTLKQLPADAQIAAAEGLRYAVQQRALQDGDAADCLLPLAISNVKAKDKTEEGADAWLCLLLELIPVVGPQQLLQHVLPLALTHGQVNEPVASRVVCCKLLGAMTPYLPAADAAACAVSTQLLAACQDTDYQVRIAAAEQLPLVSVVLGDVSAVEQVLPELSELLTDDEIQVRTAALQGLICLCEQLPHDACVAHLLPLVRQHMQPLELELPMQRTLAAAFPRLLAAVSKDLAPSDAGLMYSCFRHLAARTNADLRRICAGCVCQLMSSPLPGSSPSYLHDTWTDLAMDHDDQVRVAIASELHIMAKQVSPADAARVLRRPLCALLRDTSARVREALLAGLPHTLQALSGVEDMRRDDLVSDMHQALLVLQGSIADSWRCQQHLAAALPQLPGLLAPDAVADHWVPYAFNLLLNSAAAVKPVAARAVACLLRGCKRERARTDLLCRIIRELAWGRSCFARLAFIQVCSAALAIFSCRWFKDHLLQAIMELLSDAVPNVRLSTLGLLPALKQTIRLPEDVQQLEQLNSTMSNLMTDSDRDVAQAARSLHAAFKRTPLRMTGGTAMLDINGSLADSVAAVFEAADRVKELEEVDITICLEDIDRLSAEWCTILAERKGRRNPVLVLMDPCSSSSGSGSSSAVAARFAGSRSAGASSTASSSKGMTCTTGMTGHTAAGLSTSLSRTGVAAGAGSGPTVTSWNSPTAGTYDQRFGGAGVSSSRSTAFNSPGLSMRSAASAAAAAVTFSSNSRSSSRPGQVASSSSVGSPRPGLSNTSGPSSNTGPSSPLSSPTGPNPLNQVRLPVLAGTVRPPGVSGSSTTSGSTGQASSAASRGSLNGSSSSSSTGSPPALVAGSARMGWGGGPGGQPTSCVTTSATATSVARPSAGALSAAAGSTSSTAASSSSIRFGVSSSSSMFGRLGDAKSSGGLTTSSTSKPLPTRLTSGTIGTSIGRGKGGSASSRGSSVATGATTDTSTAATREAHRRFR